MEAARRAEIDRNYDVFQRQLANLLVDHEGEYAVLRHGEVIDFFASVGTVYRWGLSQFGDKIFSIQLVTREPVELGYWSVAVA